MFHISQHDRKDHLDNTEEALSVISSYDMMITVLNEWLVMNLLFLLFKSSSFLSDNCRSHKR